MSAPRPAADVRCPSPSCGIVFAVTVERLGRNVYCLGCGKRMTARPLASSTTCPPSSEGGRESPGLPLERLPLIVVVDNVRSLWNVGSIFRTADACGVARVVLTGITGCPPRPQIHKTALGAEDTVPWHYRADAHEAVTEARREGFTPVALESSERAVPIGSVTWPARVCLVLGNEVVGVSLRLLKSCERHVQIPMRGVKESLNVAVAFGIAAYDAARTLASR